jgi:hypothetical protein
MAKITFNAGLVPPAQTHDVDFPRLAQSLLSMSRSLLREWFPQGKLSGSEFKIGNLWGEKGDSLSINVNTGKWADFAVGQQGGDLISLYAQMNGTTNRNAALELQDRYQLTTKQATQKVIPESPRKTHAESEKPHADKHHGVNGWETLDTLPTCKHPVHGDADDAWEYRNADGKIIGVVARYNKGEGKKEFCPWTPRGGKWEMKGWEGQKPLYNLHLIAQNPTATVLICEGEKSADAAMRIAGDGYIATTWPSGASAVKNAAWDILTGRKVLIWPDNDEAGHKAGDWLKDNLDAEISTIDVSSMPPKWDAADAELEGMTAADFHVWAGHHEKQLHYKLYSLSDMKAMPFTRWIIKNIIPETGLISIYGAPATGKSFLCIDMAIAIARGQMWFGHKVKQRRVIYCALEGEAGISNRMKAIIEATKREDGLIDIITQPINVLIKEDCVRLVEAIRATRSDNPVIIIDTLNRASSGSDENSSKDMGMIIDACKWIQASVGGLVCAVHHSGKDATKGLRGHSSLLAALDVAIETTRDGDDRNWTLAKSKDGQDGIEFDFRLESVVIGHDEDGDEIHSCVIGPADEMSQSHRGLANTENNTSSKKDISAQTVIKGLSDYKFTTAITFGENINMKMGSNDATRRKQVGRLLDDVAEMGFIERDGKGWRVTEKGVRVTIGQRVINKGIPDNMPQKKLPKTAYTEVIDPEDRE